MSTTLKGVDKSSLYKKYGPLIITSFCGFYMIIAYYLNPNVFPGSVINVGASDILDLVATINLFAVFVAVIVLTQNNYAKYKGSSKLEDKFMGWEVIIAMLITAAVGLYFGSGGTTYANWILYTLTAASAATYSPSAYWHMYALYRAFRLKTLEGTLLLVSGLIAFAGLSGWGMTYIPTTSILYNWFNFNILNSVSRAVMIAAAVGAGVASFRTLIWEEHAYVRRA